MRRPGWVGGPFFFFSTLFIIRVGAYLVCQLSLAGMWFVCFKLCGIGAREGLDKEFPGLPGMRRRPGAEAPLIAGPEGAPRLKPWPISGARATARARARATDRATARARARATDRARARATDRARARATDRARARAKCGGPSLRSGSE